MRVRTSIRVGAVVAACALAAAPVTAQPALLELPDGRTIEVLGLRRWTLGQLQDSLARYAPGDSLQSHACAATLRYVLGFADASSTTFHLERGKPAQVVVSVREPQDSARVHYRRLPLDTADARPGWRQVTALMAKRPWLVDAAVRSYQFESVAEYEVPRFRTAEDSSAVAAVVAFLRMQRSEDAHQDALSVLAGGSNMYDRSVAAAILGNFGRSDATWHALVDALRESDGPVKGTASTVLHALSMREPRPVGWGPAREAIHAILDGTSLFMVNPLVVVLTTTGAGPDDAPAFLRGGGEMLLAHLSSRNSMLSNGAHRLLVQLRGRDLGRDPRAWQTWIASL